MNPEDEVLEGEEYEVDDQKSQISNMLNSPVDELDDIEDTVDDTSEELPEEEETVVEAEETDDVVEEETTQDEPEEEIVEEGEVEEEDNDTVATLRATIASLSQQLEGRNLPTPTPVEESNEETPASTTPALPVSSDPLEPIEYIKDQQQLLALLRDPAAFNKILNDIRAQAQEAALRSVPTLVGPIAQQHIELTTAINRFYTENNDLAPYKPYVKTIFAKLQSQDKEGKPLETLLDEAAKQVRKDLALSAKAKDIESSRKTSTAKVKKAPFAGNSSARKAPPPEVGDQKKQILQMIGN